MSGVNIVEKLQQQINNLNDLAASLRRRPIKTRVAVVCPDDPHTRYVMERAAQEGVADFLVFDDAGSPDKAAREAVRAVRERRADVLMKGRINTDNLLRAVLDKENGLLVEGGVLSHVTVGHIPAYGKLIAFSDAAVIPRPSLAQFDAMVGYLAAVERRLGVGRPNIALIHCTEKTSEKFPQTLSYAEIKARAAGGRYGDIVVDGPMDVKTACDKHSAQIKGICSPVVGQADALIFPDIEAGNTFYKTVSVFGGATLAGMLCGTTAPVVVSSRADSGESKYFSLALACLMSGR